jgi:hypothetical protein
MKSIKGIKLITGEEVIAEFGILPEGRFVLKNPVQIRIMPPQFSGGQPSAGFVPFPAFSEQSKDHAILVEPLHVVYTYDPDEQIVQNYNQMFGSGIITPPKKLITG